MLSLCVDYRRKKLIGSSYAMLGRRAFALLSTASVDMKAFQAATTLIRRRFHCMSTQKYILAPANTTYQNDTRPAYAFQDKSIRIRNILTRFYCDAHRKEWNFKVAKSKELIKDAIKTKQSNLRERKEVFVKDLRETKTIVQDRVQEKVKKMEGIVERENILTIPNLLCVGRGLLSPVVGYAIVQEQYMLSIGLLAFAGLTDLADGFIARTWPSQATKIGSFLDPMADKLLVGALVISLSLCHLFPIWLSIMVLCRDVFLIIAGFVIRFISLPPPKTLSRYFDATHVTAKLEPTFISKVNTGVQLVTIGASLGAPIWSYIDHSSLHGLWYLTGITTLAAGLSYILQKDTYKIVKSSLKKKS